MGFFGAAHGWGGGKKAPISKICQTYPTMMKLGIVIPYLKRIQKIKIWITWHTPWLLLTSGFFHRKSANFAMSIYIFCYIWFLTFLESLKIVLIKMVTIWWCQQKWLPKVFLKYRYFEIKVMASLFLSMTSPTKFYHVIQIIM